MPNLAQIALAIIISLTSVEPTLAADIDPADSGHPAKLLKLLQSADRSVVARDNNSFALPDLFANLAKRELFWMHGSEMHQFLMTEKHRQLLTVELDPESVQTNEEAVRLSDQLESFVNALGYRRAIIVRLTGNGYKILKDIHRVSRDNK